MYLQEPRPYAVSFSAPFRGVSGCTVKTIHNHESCCRAVDEFGPHRLDCNTRNGARIKKRSQRVGAGGMYELGPLLRACQGEAMPITPDVRSGGLGPKVQTLHDLSNRRDDWHAVLPRRRARDSQVTEADLFVTGVALVPGADSGPRI